jgi:hypothetical protein
LLAEYRILSPTAILGYGFPESSFAAGLKKKPHLIAADAGSTDPGPYYLGAGISFTERLAVKRDLALMLTAGFELDIPLIIGTAGGSGGEPHLSWTAQIVREIAAEKKLSFKLALIHAEIERDFLLTRLRQGKLSPLGSGSAIKEQDITEAVRIVGQMGVEPFIRALNEGARVILAGRAYDPAVFAAPAIAAGFEPGLAIHLGKILECGAIAATPGSGSDCLFGVLNHRSFTVEPLNPQRSCTVTSVAAHTLYEKNNPLLLPGPGGTLDLSACQFRQENSSAGQKRIVRVSGSRFIPAARYTVKIEGVKRIGFRTVCIAGCRDPVMIKNIKVLMERVRERVKDNFSRENYPYYLDFKLYGLNGVMGAGEPVRTTRAHELGIIIEAVAPTQEIANAICSFTRTTMLHADYPGRIATAGNLAFPYSPSDFATGEVFNFHIYHLLEVDDPCAIFPVEIIHL